jgi:hypothetical protein
MPTSVHVRRPPLQPIGSPSLNWAAGCLPFVRRVLGEPAAVYLWLALTAVGLVAAVLAGSPWWALAGWAVGGVAAAVVAVRRGRGR